MGNKRLHRAYNKKHAKSTSKLIDRIAYSPAKHKNKERRRLRQELQSRVLQIPRDQEPRTFLKFGAFNINGWDLEVGWAINQLISDRCFDVSFNYK